MRLLYDQIGVVDFEPLKPLLLQAVSRGRTAANALPSLHPIFYHPHRNFKEAGPRSGLPAVGLKLATLLQRLQQACLTYYHAYAIARIF